MEHETARNLEVSGLADTLRPSYKTIATTVKLPLLLTPLTCIHAGKNNGTALTAITKDFVLLCRQLNLFKGDEAAVDGSFFKADASKDSLYMAKKLAQQRTELDKKITVETCGVIKANAQLATRVHYAGSA